MDFILQQNIITIFLNKKCMLISYITVVPHFDKNI